MPNIFLIFSLSLFQVFSFSQDVKKIDSLQLVFEETKDPTQKSEILTSISSEYLNSDTEKALAIANQAYDLAIENDDVDGKFKSMFLLIRIYHKSADYLVAVDMATQAKNLADKYKMKKELASAYFWIGIILGDIYQFEKALTMFMRA